MILLHRITPLFATLVTLFGFLGIIWFGWNPIVLFVFVFLITALLLMRLLSFQFDTFQFWYLIGTPIIFLLSSFGLFLFFESNFGRIFLAIFTTLLFFLFTEHVFTYTHIPANYKPYSIEYLSLLLNILTIFFASSVGFGVQLFLNIPLWILSSIFFLILLFVVYGILWVSKVPVKQARPYAIAGAILSTELFIVTTFLPTGFYTNAAVITLFSYLFLGLTRARFLNTLTQKVLRRYLAIAFILFILITTTAQWL